MSTHDASKTLWTYAAYAGLPDDGQRHEIIQGDHCVNLAPSLYHQTISRRLQFQLYAAIEEQELGFVFNAPVDVQLTAHDIVQPDLVIIRKANKHIMTPSRVKGIPDLLIEILSPSNSQHDLETKRLAYQRCGVPEYWIVDPDEHHVLQMQLADGSYDDPQVHADAVAFDIPPLLNIDLRRVW